MAVRRGQRLEDILEILNKYTNYLVTLEERALKNFGSEKLNELLSSLLQVSQGDVPRALAER